MTDSALHIRETLPWPRLTFADRLDAGRDLRDWIGPARDPDALVLALPRGGVPVGKPLAEAIGCAMAPILVRKLPLPSSPEMGFGAVTVDGTVTLNPQVVDAFGIGEATVQKVVRETQDEVIRRSKAYPGGWPLPALKGRHVWLVDDGLATGFSAIAAARMIRAHDAAHVTLCVPCSPLNAVRRLAEEVDEVWCAIAQTGGSFAVAAFYRDFHDMSDAEVVELLG